MVVGKVRPPAPPHSPASAWARLAAVDMVRSSWSHRDFFLSVAVGCGTRRIEKDSSLWPGHLEALRWDEERGLRLRLGHGETVRSIQSQVEPVGRGSITKGHDKKAKRTKTWAWGTSALEVRERKRGKRQRGWGVAAREMGGRGS